MSTLVGIAARRYPLTLRSALVRRAYTSTPDLFVAPRLAERFHTGTTDHNSLAKKRPNEQADVGTEGLHRSNLSFHVTRGRSGLIMRQRTNTRRSRC